MNFVVHILIIAMVYACVHVSLHRQVPDVLILIS